MPAPPASHPAVEILDDADAAATRAAEVMAAAIVDAQAARGVAVVAISGGTTPRPLFERLAGADLDWSRLVVTQVDERIVGPDDPARNLRMQRLVLPGARFLPLPVDAADRDGALAHHLLRLREVAGDPPVFDIVQLGLGDDGHTASWPPGRGLPVGEIAEVLDFAGHDRLTLTPAPVNRARRRLFFVTGAAKAPMVAGLLAADPSLPATAVQSDGTLVVVDRDAAGPSSPR